MGNKRSSRIMAGITALGMSVFGLLGYKEHLPIEPEEQPLPPVVETDSSEGNLLDRYPGLKISCPKLSTAADAFLFTTPESAVLIDTGEDVHARRILNLLEENHVTCLDALILTHFDRDHIGGAAEVLNRIQVNYLYRTEFEGDSEQYAALLDALRQNPQTEVVTLTETILLELGEVTYILYPPMEHSYAKDEDNNSSIITAVFCSKGGQTLLFAGDAEKARVKEFLSNQYDGTQYDFLKIPHHGRDPKPLQKLLKKFVPEHALITSSASEREHSALMTKLQEAGTEVWLTREGSITVFCDENGMDVTQEE